MTEADVVDAMVGLAMLRGHDPRDVRKYPMRDLYLMMFFDPIFGHRPSDHRG